MAGESAGVRRTGRTPGGSERHGCALSVTFHVKRHWASGRRGIASRWGVPGCEPGGTLAAVVAGSTSMGAAGAGGCGRASDRPTRPRLVGRTGTYPRPPAEGEASLHVKRRTADPHGRARVLWVVAGSSQRPRGSIQVVRARSLRLWSGPWDSPRAGHVSRETSCQESFAPVSLVSRGVVGLDGGAE